MDFSVLLFGCGHSFNESTVLRAPTSVHLDCSLAFVQIKNSTDRQRAIGLVLDPAHNGNMTSNSLREAEIGLELERLGVLKGPIERDPTGQSEFLDANGQAWDVKAFRMADASTLSKVLELRKTEENWILDTSFLSHQDKVKIETVLLQNSLSRRVVWYPHTKVLH